MKLLNQTDIKVFIDYALIRKKVKNHKVAENQPPQNQYIRYGRRTNETMVNEISEHIAQVSKVMNEGD